MRAPEEYAHLLPDPNDPCAEFLDPRSWEEMDRDFNEARRKLAEAVEQLTAIGKETMSDKERLDFLEAFINKEGAILLHDGSKTGFPFPGLGLRPGFVNRTLREAIDECSGFNSQTYAIPKSKRRKP